MLLPARTIQYIDALNREGDRFDYHKWLKRVRDEEATQPEHVPPLINSREPTPSEIDNLIDTPDRRAALMLPGLGVVTRPATVRRPLFRANEEGKCDTLNARLRRRLEKVRDAWKQFQSCRTRDAVYPYQRRSPPSLNITKRDERPADFCSMRSNLPAYRLTKTPTHLRPLFAALVTAASTTRQSANGLDLYVMSPITRFLAHG